MTMKKEAYWDQNFLGQKRKEDKQKNENRD